MSKIEINYNLCLARKNQKKDFHVQCPLHKKNNTDFCGKHRNYLANKLIPINKKPIVRSRNNTIVSECEDTSSQKNEVKSPKLSKKKHLYMIKPYEYHKIYKANLTLVDYLYDKELKYSDAYIKKTFKFYQLNKYSKNKLRHRFKTDDEKKHYMKGIKIKLQDFLI